MVTISIYCRGTERIRFRKRLGVTGCWMEETYTKIDIGCEHIQAVKNVLNAIRDESISIRGGLGGARPFRRRLNR